MAMLSLTADGASGASDGRVDGDVGSRDGGGADRVAGHRRVLLAFKVDARRAG